MPNALIEDILFISGFETTKSVAQANQTIISEGVMKRIFEDRIIKIIPLPSEYGATVETSKNDEPFLEIRNSDRVMPLFQEFGEKVKKIHVYHNLKNDHIRHDINKNIIKKYANQLHELGIFILNDNRLWKEISNEHGQVHFPEVKKFIYDGPLRRNPFDMKSIFPKLECFQLVGHVTDTNCLANVTQLKQLTLETRSIQEHQLVQIFKNNNDLVELSLRMPCKKATLNGIDEYLKKLKTLQIKNADIDFFTRSTNNVCNLTSVTYFDVAFKKTDELVENLSFDMPNLNKLKLFGWRIDNRINDFINRFEHLETVCMRALSIDDPMGCIKSLKHIKELAIDNFENTKLTAMKEFFENFDEAKSHLKTLKLIGFKDAQYPIYEKTMKEINNHLNEHKKPIWLLSHGQLERTTEKYLMFERKPQKSD